MLRVSKSEYLFDPLQQLLSPSVVNRRAWSHRRLHRSMQRETRIMVERFHSINVMKSIEGSTSCSSHIIFISGAKHGLCSIVSLAPICPSRQIQQYYKSSIGGPTHLYYAESGEQTLTQVK